MHLKFLPTLILLALPVPHFANHLGRLVVQQDFIPSAVVGKPFSYPCAAQWAGGISYTYSCVSPGCVMPPGLTIDSAGIISGTPQAAGSTDTQMGLNAPSDGTFSVQGLRVEVIRAEAWNSWCPRGHFGGNVSTVALNPNFTSNNQAMAGATNGGLLYSSDGGASWIPQDNFGPLPVGALAADQCLDPMKVWAVTLPANHSWSTDVGPLGTVAASNPGTIQNYAGGILTFETLLPATWTGRHRQIRQAYLNCQAASGNMVASDDEGGILWRNGVSGLWSAANVNLPLNLGKINARDVVYGYTGFNNLAATLISYPDNSVATIYRNPTLTSAAAAWSSCVNLKNLTGAVGHWQALALAPDGLLIAGSSNGEVGLGQLGAGGACPAGPTAGPGFLDGSVAVKPAVNGFVFPACYGTGGLKQVYAYTDSGVFYTANVSTTAFSRIGQGLLSEEIAAMGLAKSAACTDNRMVLGTRRQGTAYGDAAGFCPGQLRATASFNAIAGGQNFTSPGAVACVGNPGSVPLYAGSASNGVYRAAATGREFFTAGDTRELVITDVAAANNGAGDTVYAAAFTGVYKAAGASMVYTYDGFTPEPLLKLAAATTTTTGRAYGISTSSIYSSSTASPWRNAVLFPNGAGAVDLAPGGPLTAASQDDEMWIAYGVNGLLEFQNIAGVPTIVAQTGLAGLDVRRVTARKLPALSNAVFVQVKSGGVYSLRVGVKNTIPASQISFSTLSATGLPTNEEAIQIVVEPAGNSALLWVLLPTQGLYYSGNGGGSFTRAVAGLPANYIPRAILPARDFDSTAGKRDLALLVAGKGVYYSRDGGATFCYGPASLSDVPIGIQSVASRRTPVVPILPTDDIIAAGTDHGVFVSDDNGAHWHNRSPADQRFSTLMYHPLPAAGNALLAGSVDGIWRSTNDALTWTHVYIGGNVTAFAQDYKNCSTDIVATLSGGATLKSTDQGVTFAAQSSPVDGAAVDRADCLTGGITASPNGATAPYWMAGTSSGASWSATGATWTAANGANPDYLLPAASGFASVRTLGGTPSQVLVGHGSAGLFRTLNGGDTWRKVSGTGSGLEFTSQNAAAMITATTSFSTTDILVGMSGSTTGGVYLSGDSGEHWTQINQGFDPSNLNMATLVKTSCSGCPVQYYSGTYGSGVYTRTIAVVAPPAITGWCFGGGCTSGSACVTTPPSGPEDGAQTFKLCVNNLQNLAAIEFDGVGVSIASCTYTLGAGSSVFCTTATPPHFPAAVSLRVRNPDTRAGTANQLYTYTGGTSRATGLRVAKAGNDANLTYTCTGCTTPPPRVYRSQNAPFTLNLEQYTGGAGSYSNTGALAAGANPNYFWSVE